MMLAAVLTAIAFVVIAAILCAAAVLVILGTAQVYLSGPEALEHDGLARGQRAPRWALADASGVRHTSPPARPLQLVVFADHSLKSFPSVLDGLRELIAARPRTGDRRAAAAAQRAGRAAAGDAGPGRVPVLTGTPGLYADYNVRVGPFAIFVDSGGLVRASSLVNHDWQIAKLRQLADIPVDPAEIPAPRWPRRRLARAGV